MKVSTYRIYADKRKFGIFKIIHLAFRPDCIIGICRKEKVIMFIMVGESEKG